MMEIVLQNVTYRYPSVLVRGVEALRNVSLVFRPGELCALVGPAGSGKTTLIQMMNGLLRPTDGKVTAGGRDLADKMTDINNVRKTVGLVFQFPENQLFEETVFADIAYGPKNLGLSEAETEKSVARAMKMVGLGEDYRAKSPFHLSGGEQRRAALAGILALDPEILVLDEPTVGLDGKGSAQTEAIIQAYHREGKSVLFISHDMDLVARLAIRIVVLCEGRVIFDGPKNDLFQNPDLLQKAGLMMPRVPRYMALLKQRGWKVRTDIYTIERAKEEIRQNCLK